MVHQIYRQRNLWRVWVAFNKVIGFEVKPIPKCLFITDLLNLGTFCYQTRCANTPSVQSWNVIWEMWVAIFNFKVKVTHDEVQILAVWFSHFCLSYWTFCNQTVCWFKVTNNIWQVLVMVMNAQNIVHLLPCKATKPGVSPSHFLAAFQIVYLGQSALFQGR